MQHKFIDVDGIRTHYVEAGTGKPLLLLHGGGLTSTGEGTFFRQVEGLSDAFRVIALDQIGFGRTDVAKDGKYKNRLERCGHVVAFLNSIGISEAYVGGHSEGGFVATRIAIDHPKLVSKLIIISSGSTAPMLGGDKDEAWLKAADTAYNYPESRLTEDVAVENARRSRHVFDSRMESILRDAYRHAMESGKAKVFLNMPETERDQRQFNEFQKVHLLPFLGKIKQSTLLIWSSDDATVPVERGVRLRELLPHADFHVLARSGHPVTTERADAVNELLRGFCTRPEPL